MNVKINILCFILLLFLFIGIASATDNNNETLQMDNNDDKVSLCQNTSIIAKTTTTKVTSQVSKVSVNLKASDVKVHYKDSGKFKITLKDNKNKAIKNAKVKIALNGKTYTKTTDSKGIATLTLNLNSGTYKVTTTYDGSSKYQKKSVKSTITVKSTIKTSDLTKFYKNKSTFSATFYDKKGKLIKETSVKFKLNGKNYTAKTSPKGIARLDIDLKPGSYKITVINSKTSESIVKTITIKSTMETHDLVMNASDGSQFSVKIINVNGKPSSNKVVTFKVYGDTYTAKTNSKGIASIKPNLPEGTYIISSEYDGLINKNTIKVGKTIVKAGVIKTNFTHTLSLPNYVNITSDYVFSSTNYAIKTGFDGIIKIPKKLLITIETANKTYYFSHSKISNLNTTYFGYEYHLIPFNNSNVFSNYKKENIYGEGIIISNNGNYTLIEFRDVLRSNTSVLSVNLSDNGNNTQKIIYTENGVVKAQINISTYKFDESGLKYNLARLNNLDNYNSRNYIELTENNTNSIRYTNTNESVKFDSSYTSIVNSLLCENIKTEFKINKTIYYNNNTLVKYSDGLFEKIGVFTNKEALAKTSEFDTTDISKYPAVLVGV